MDVFFFTDGQANVSSGTNHFNALEDLDKIDWSIIHDSSFSKSADDFDRPRRYQAEFLVQNHVPTSAIESIVVYNATVHEHVKSILKEQDRDLTVKVIREYFF